MPTDNINKRKPHSAAYPLSLTAQPTITVMACAASSCLFARQRVYFSLGMRRGACPDWRNVMLDNFLYSLNATMPVFAVMALGWALKKIRLLRGDFTAVADKLVFYVALPAKLFLETAEMDVAALTDRRFVLYCFGVSLASILLIWALARLFMPRGGLRGSFVQGAYRSSAALLGVALIENIYGSAGYAPLMILGCVPLYNVMAVVVLTAEGGGSGKGSGVRRAALGVVKNPTIIAIALGLAAALLRLRLPVIADKTVSSVAALATPLALINIGAAFELGEARERLRPALAASAIKLVALPALGLPLAAALGFRGQALTAALIMLGAPTTASSYIMARSMGGDAPLASGVIVLTTLLAAVTLTLWVFLLRTLGLMA